MGLLMYIFLISKSRTKIILWEVHYSPMALIYIQKGLLVIILQSRRQYYHSREGNNIYHLQSISLLEKVNLENQPQSEYMASRNSSHKFGIKL